jgi:hypothetical protein
VPGVRHFEAGVGDVFVQHMSTFHAVYNHAADRRVLTFSCAAFPDERWKLASLWHSSRPGAKQPYSSCPFDPCVIHPSTGGLRVLTFEPHHGNVEILYSYYHATVKL